MEYHPDILVTNPRPQTPGGSTDECYGGGHQHHPQHPLPQPEHPPQAPSNNSKPIKSVSSDKLDFNQTFPVVKPRYNDIWASILFMSTFAGFTVVSAIAIQGYSTAKPFQGGSIYSGARTVGLSTNTITLFSLVLAAAFVLISIYFWVVRAFTKQILWITGILHIVFGIGTTIAYIVRHQYGAGIVFVIFAVFYIFCFISWIPRIPFSVIMLQTTIDVSKNYGHLFLVSLIGGLIATGFGVWFSITLVAIYATYEPGNNPACSQGFGGCSTARVTGSILFITFASYRITEVLKNIIHVTISGVYGSWYFYSQKPGGFPNAATRGSFRRSITYSLGSISFGSLVVAIIQFLRQACSVAQNNKAVTRNTMGSILFCILGYFLGVLDWVTQLINEYAFSYIALYGKAFLPAAKTTWAMMKDRGIDTLVNECLINPVLTMGSVFVAYVCSFLAYLYLEFTKPAYNSTGSFTPVAMAFAFLLSLQICNIFLVPIKSGVSTIFVAMAFDPEVLMSDFPDLYLRLVHVYPHVQQAIHA